MIKKCTLLVAVCAITACASNSPKQKWIKKKKKKKKKEKKKCTVTTESFYSGGSVYTLNGNFYPYIQKDDSNVIVGVRSGGKVKMPVGNIQLFSPSCTLFLFFFLFFFFFFVYFVFVFV